MVWDEGTADLWELIDQIADDLIALPEWEEGDATWDTSVKTDRSARRVCRHIADDVYLSLIMENGVQYNRYSTTYYHWKGLVIIMSTAWNAGTHEPDGTKHYTYAGFESRGTGSTSYVNADLADFALSYHLFTGAGGFALVGIPPPNATDIYQSNFIAIVERSTDKLYADGYSNFYVFVDGNYFPAYLHNYVTFVAYFGVTPIWNRYSRCFHLQAHAEPAYERAYEAFKSIADSKAYFTKPVLHNEDDGRYPIYYPEFWIAVDSTKVNLADDDEIAMPAPSTKSYQVMVKQSPDSIVYIMYAIIKTE